MSWSNIHDLPAVYVEIMTVKEKCRKNSLLIQVGYTNVSRYGQYLHKDTIISTISNSLCVRGKTVPWFPMFQIPCLANDKWQNIERLETDLYFGSWFQSGLESVPKQYPYLDILKSLWQMQERDQRYHYRKKQGWRDKMHEQDTGQEYISGWIFLLDRAQRKIMMTDRCRVSFTVAIGK